MLKNFTVITQPVKNGLSGVFTRERYITSSRHPNHSNTEEIINIIGSDITSQRIAHNGEKYKLNQKIKNSRRGRTISSYAIEFCLTLPKGYRPTPEQWRAVIKDCVISLSYHLRFNKEERQEFYKNIRAVCHRQDQSSAGAGAGAGDHVHLIVGKVINNKVVTELQRKSSTSFIKSSYNNALMKHIGIDIKSYKTYELNRGKRLEKWKYSLNEIKKKEREINKIKYQIEKLIEAKNKGDITQQKRQLNRIKKNIIHLSDIEIKSLDIEKLIS